MKPETVEFEITAHGGARRFGVERVPDGLSIRSPASDSQPTPVRLDPLEGKEWWRLTTRGATIPIRLHQVEGTVQVTVGAERIVMTVRRSLPVPSRRPRTDAVGASVAVRAPMPGLVVTMPFRTGQTVDQGNTVAIVEAMKMQMEVPAPVAGRVEDVRVRPGQEVSGDQVLLVIRIVPKGAP